MQVKKCMQPILFSFSDEGMMKVVLCLSQWIDYIHEYITTCRYIQKTNRKLQNLCFCGEEIMLLKKCHPVQEKKN